MSPSAKSLFEAVDGPLLMELYPGLTPATVYELTISEYNALVRHARKRAKETKDELAKIPSRR